MISLEVSDKSRLVKEKLNRVLTKIRFEFYMNKERAKILLTKMKWLLLVSFIGFSIEFLAFIIVHNFFALILMLIYWLLFWAMVMLYVWLLRFKEIDAEIKTKPIQDEIGKMFSEAIKKSNINQDLVK